MKYTYFSRLTAAGFPQLEIQKLTDEEAALLPDGVPMWPTRGECKVYLNVQNAKNRIKLK